MKIKFSKYQGTGNDFIIIDNRDELFDSNNVTLVNKLCNRRFGIGADGLMLLENSINTSFKMRYFNSDGKEGSMCGNGGRCIAAFAVNSNLIINPQYFTFDAVDGLHEARYNNGVVSLKMSNVTLIEKTGNDFFLNTGSPHFVRFTDDIDKISVYNEGKAIRWSEPFQPGGTNVNFVSRIDENKIKVRTFERGVEDETLSCGTGVVASSIASHLHLSTSKDLQIEVLGGELNVSFQSPNNGKVENIWLTGPATFVFEGYIHI
jgi:diaminopimelate epimerase